VFCGVATPKNAIRNHLVIGTISRKTSDSTDKVNG
jgi:hypothetical protein